MITLSEKVPEKLSAQTPQELDELTQELTQPVQLSQQPFQKLAEQNVQPKSLKKDEVEASIIQRSDSHISVSAGRS